MSKIIQVVFICSGCDFVSYFVRLGKQPFFNTFFQYAAFICGLFIENAEGTLSNTNLDEDSDFGWLAFYPFIGCVYFTAHRSCLNKYISPIELFQTLHFPTKSECHKQFLEIIRKATWKGTYKDELLPSDSALQFHWLRSCLVSTVWGLALEPVFMYPNVSEYGWNRLHADDDTLSFEVLWDTETNIQRIRTSVKFLTRGCSCSKSKCKSRVCKCRKADRQCGPGCTCKDCENVVVATVHDIENTTLEQSCISVNQDVPLIEEHNINDLNVDFF